MIMVIKCDFIDKLVFSPELTKLFTKLLVNNLIVRVFNLVINLILLLFKKTGLYQNSYFFTYYATVFRMF